jgi:hypothetical protein
MRKYLILFLVILFFPVVGFAQTGPMGSGGTGPLVLSPAGSSSTTEILYNNAGVVDGFDKLTTDGTDLTLDGIFNIQNTAGNTGIVFGSLGTATNGIDMSSAGLSGSDKYFNLNTNDFWEADGDLKISGNITITGSNTIFTNTMSHFTGGATPLTIGSNNEISIRTDTGTTTIGNGSADTVPILTIKNTGGDFDWFRDDASPEGVITGDIGDVCIDTTAGEIYIKESDATNTGWQPVGGGVSAFSSMWYHGVELTTTISTVSTMTQVTSFENVGFEDSGGNAVGDATTDDDITINLAGTYEIEVGCSFRNASGSNKNMVICPGVTLATPKTITDATNATPIVITSAAHGLLNGDMVTISGVGGNTAANGDFYVSNKAANTFELETLPNVDVAGNGAYTSGGTIDIIYPGEIALERVVSGTDLGRGTSEGSISLAVGDIVELYVANETDANNFVLSQLSMKVIREE